MSVSTDHPVQVFRVHPATLWVAAMVALLLQAFLPLKVPLARLMDFPLLVVIYFSLVRRDKIFGIGLGTSVGLLEDALSHGFIGIHGISQAIVGYLAASSSTRFELESLLARAVMTGVFVLIHSLCLAGLEQVLLENPPAFDPLSLAAGILVNVALGLLVFQLLDRFRHPA
jgi:rod shape-determining protein MreD